MLFGVPWGQRYVMERILDSELHTCDMKWDVLWEISVSCYPVQLIRGREWIYNE